MPVSEMTLARELQSHRGSPIAIERRWRRPLAEVVVITGASAGIGRATAREFAKHGCKVALLARGRAGLEAAARDVEELGGEAIVIQTDVADWTAVEHAANQVVERFGRIDVWVNNAFAGIFSRFM